MSLEVSEFECPTCHGAQWIIQPVVSFAETMTWDDDLKPCPTCYGVGTFVSRARVGLPATALR